MNISKKIVTSFSYSLYLGRHPLLQQKLVIQKQT